MMALISTLETPGEFDVLTSLRPNEPYFVLVGRDKLAPPQVLSWAMNNRERALKDYGAGNITQAKLDEELRKSTQAEEIAWAMQEYKKGHPTGWEVVQQAFEPDEKPKPYSGAVLPEQTQLSDKLQSVRARAAAAINQAEAELATLDEVLLVIDKTSDDLEELQQTVQVERETLRRVSDIVQPPRMGIKA
jgi:hypothetical protein